MIEFFIAGIIILMLLFIFVIPAALFCAILVIGVAFLIHTFKEEAARSAHLDKLWADAHELRMKRYGG